MTDSPLVRVSELKKHFPVTSGILHRETGRVRAVDGISFEIARGETLGLVGESGCGKTTAAKTLLRLEPPTEGTVLFDGEDLASYSRQELTAFRRRAQMVFQDPSTSFDPRMSIGESIAEPLLIHGLSDRSARENIVENILERVGLDATDAYRYPHEFSGGQKQRIAFARALVVNPDFVILDEPVSALDVSVQAEILSLIRDLQTAFDLAVLFISHDLSVVKAVCDRVAVMYLGEIVEVAPTDVLFADPQHPYSQGLIASIPEPDPRSRPGHVELTGDVGDPISPPPGCRFHPRCPAVIPPPTLDIDQDSWRRVMDFRSRLRAGDIDLKGIRETVVRETNTEPAVSASSRATEAFRLAMDLPLNLGDPTADDRLDTAINHLVSGNHADGIKLLVDGFPSICDRRRPTLCERSSGRTVSCHLYDPDSQA